jgi:hypothetical protein
MSLSNWKRGSLARWAGFPGAGGEIVDAENGVALAQQAVGEVRTKKSGGAGNKYAHGQKFSLRPDCGQIDGK